jgi:uncharacterized protein (DUF2384 family)
MGSEPMLSDMQTGGISDLIQARIGRKIDEVTAAFDREAARRNAMREKLAGINAEILLAAIDCLGSVDGAAFWLSSPEAGLAGGCPLDVALSAEGKEKVMDPLWRLNRGPFA